MQQRLWAFFFEEERPKHFEKANCRTGFVVAVGLGNRGVGRGHERKAGTAVDVVERGKKCTKTLSLTDGVAKRILRIKA